MLKILQARLQQYMNRELSDIQLNLEKGEESDQMPTCTGSSKKQKSFRKTSISALLTMQPTPVFLPVESHGQRSLVGYSPRSHKESDTTE